MHYDNQIATESNNFYGTKQYFKHPFDILYTNGIKWLKEKLECNFILDDIAILSKTFRLRNPFITCEFTSNPEKLFNKKETGRLIFSNDNDNIICSFGYTLSSLKTTAEEPLLLWLIYDKLHDKHILYLPNEY